MKLGADILFESRVRLLEGSRVGLIVNPASINSRYEHTADLFHSHHWIKLTALFGPQHGIRGETQDNMIEWQTFRDKRTGLPAYSLYGETRKPLPEMLAGVDVLVFDVPDVPGELIVVAERDDGVRAFGDVLGRLGPTGRIAVGDRTRAETTLELQRAAGGDLVAGSRLVNVLRRVKSQEELAVMEQACAIAERTMAAVTPAVVPGTTMLDLLDIVERELRANGSRTASFPTHVFTGDLVLDSGGLVPVAFVVRHTDGEVVVDPPDGLLEL